MHLLLIAGDVEANPGPSSKATRQATLSQSAQGDLTVGEPSLADIMKEIRDCKTDLTVKIDLMVESVNKRCEELEKENRTLKEDLAATKQKLVDLEDRSR